MLHYLIIPRQDFFISVEVKGLSNPSTSQRLHHELLLVWWQSNISTLPIVEACPSPFLTQIHNECRPLSRKHLTLERGEAEGVSDRSIAAIVRTTYPSCIVEDSTVSSAQPLYKVADMQYNASTYLPACSCHVCKQERTLALCHKISLA